MKIIIYSLLFIFFITSCKKQESSNNSSIDFSYCPLKVGNWIAYNVVDINIDEPSKVHDTLNYKIKEIIESKFEDNKMLVYRIERFIKMSDSVGWTIKDVWFANYTTNSIQKVEENVRFVKIVFPVIINNSWNGNAYNLNDSKEYEITTLDIPETINSLTFDSVMHVTQLNISNLIEKKLEIEKYAKNIGLVYKELTDIYSGTVSYGVPIENRITTASIYKMTISDYGTN